LKTLGELSCIDVSLLVRFAPAAIPKSAALRYHRASSRGLGARIAVFVGELAEIVLRFAMSSLGGREVLRKKKEPGCALESGPSIQKENLEHIATTLDCRLRDQAPSPTPTRAKHLAGLQIVRLRALARRHAPTRTSHIAGLQTSPHFAPSPKPTNAEKRTSRPRASCPHRRAPRCTSP